MTQKHHNESVDTNIESLSKAESFITKNGKNIAIGVVAVVVIVVGALVLKAIGEKKDAKANAAFTFIEQEVLTMGDSLSTAVALENLELYIEDHGRHAAGVATFDAGVAAYAAKDYNKAIEYFSEFKSDDAIFNARALACIGDCYAQLGNYEEAYKNYTLAVEEADNEFASEYAFRAGLAAEKLGKNAEAVAMYEVIKNQYPTTPRASDIEKYISRAEAK